MNCEGDVSVIKLIPSRDLYPLEFENYICNISYID